MSDAFRTNQLTKDDGLLKASEISELKLNAAGSCCRPVIPPQATALERKPYLALRAHSFIYAGGAISGGVALGLVDDETALLMSDLFKRGSQNQSLSHGEALQQAQLNMLNNAKDDEDAHPRVWGPFVVVGEPAKLN